MRFRVGVQYTILTNGRLTVAERNSLKRIGRFSVWESALLFFFSALKTICTAFSKSLLRKIELDFNVEDDIIIYDVLSGYPM